jgi:outer membrane protein OmpA-like peptidoglycan-associated protein
VLFAAALLAGCGGGNPLDTPVSWFHDLEGGVIAEQRPPPPGVGMPYPKLVSVPARPTLPDAKYRDALEEKLLAERDRTERIAAHAPVEPPVLGPPSPSAVPPAPAAGAAGQAAPGAAPPAIQASLPAAQAPAAAPPAPPPAAAADAPVFLVGDLPADTGAASIPAAPPPPATFEGVPAEPAPTPSPPTPAHLPAALRGTDILFLPGEAILRQSQMQTLQQIAGSRKKRRLQITGLGEAVSDTPDGQAAAIELGLKRAQAVAQAFASLHVPDNAMVLSAYAFGRGAEVKVLPGS